MSTTNDEPQSRDLPPEHQTPSFSPGAHNAEAVSRPSPLSIYFQQSANIMSQEIPDEQKSTNLGRLDSFVRGLDQVRARQSAEETEVNDVLIAAQRRLIASGEGLQNIALKHAAAERERREVLEEELRLRERKLEEAQAVARQQTEDKEEAVKELQWTREILEKCTRHERSLAEELLESGERELKQLRKNALSKDKDEESVATILLKREIRSLKLQVKYAHQTVALSWIMGWMLMYYEVWKVLLVMCFLVFAIVWTENNPHYGHGI